MFVRHLGCGVGLLDLQSRSVEEILHGPSSALQDIICLAENLSAHPPCPVSQESIAHEPSTDGPGGADNLADVDDDDDYEYDPRMGDIDPDDADGPHAEL